MTAEALDVEAKQTSVLIIDDHAAFAELLTLALEREPDLHGAGFARSVAAGLGMCQRLQPDVVVMDCRLPDGSGTSAAARIRSLAPQARVVLLTAQPTAEELMQAAAAGACAFLAKGASLVTLLDTVRHAHPGSIEVDPLMLSAFSEHGQARSRQEASPLLTNRQMEVLRLMAEGKDVRSNAKTLGISQNTCRGYVKAIHARLGVHSQLEAVVKARQLGLLAPRIAG
ncbi:response regulator transcription factor [Arthrobacter sp.]|uniref:response regulator transcription factor n=1 Tax=Arthrobacter sp. TaxID=1667 RepID=UPI002811F92F|nr:response regulator transcription factor [Arthrobacter sp.]